MKMKKPIKAFNVSGYTNISNWLPSIQVHTLEKADVVVFPGGADVNPDIYGARKHPLTNFNPSLDDEQIEIFDMARKMGKRMVGICRGAQLLCAKAGGQLVQHQLNTHTTHDIMTFDGRVINVTSDHHQAMFPWHMAGKNFKVLAWSIGTSGIHEGGEMQEMVIGEAPLDMEVEIAFFPGIKALCIQAHPEWMYPTKNHNEDNKDALDYLGKLFERFYDGDDFANAHESFATTKLVKA